MSTFADTRKYYGVPCKRGVRVRWCPYRGDTAREGVIVAPAHGNFLYVRFDGDKKASNVYPFDIDYFVDGEWKLAADYQRIRDMKIDVWNGVLNAP